jgi:hypothetical protein
VSSFFRQLSGQLWYKVYVTQLVTAFTTKSVKILQQEENGENHQHHQTLSGPRRSRTGDA